MRAAGMSCVQDVRLLRRRVTELFALLSHKQVKEESRMGMIQDVLALAKGLAQDLKNLIRIALTGALRLEREQDVNEAMASFLDKLHLLVAKGGGPVEGVDGNVLPACPVSHAGAQCATYGCQDFAAKNAGDSPFASSAPREGIGETTHPPSDLCV